MRMCLVRIRHIVREWQTTWFANAGVWNSIYARHTHCNSARPTEWKNIQNLIFYVKWFVGGRNNAWETHVSAQSFFVKRTERGLVQKKCKKKLYLNPRTAVLLAIVNHVGVVKVTETVTNMKRKIKIVEFIYFELNLFEIEFA